jgi:hypothetical protein
LGPSSLSAGVPAGLLSDWTKPRYYKGSPRI